MISSHSRSMFLLMVATVFCLGVLSLAGTTQPAKSIDIWHEPTDVPTPKMNEHGVLNKKFMQRHAQFVNQAKQGNIDLLFLGDSITEGWFWDHNKQIWDAHFGKYHPANFGIGGDRTEHVLWRIDNGELDGIHPRVIVLLIGTNNIGWPAKDITKGVVKIVDTIHQTLPDTKLLLLAIFPRGANPKDPHVAEMRKKIKTVNAALAKLDDGNKTRFLDIADKMESPDGSLSKSIMPDALHFNHAGYEIFADAIQPIVDEMMK